MILYLHGFRSSPRSTKARQLAARLAQRGLGDVYRCPQLPVSPRDAAALIERIVGGADAPLAIIGSSLGGYYATWIAARVECRVVLLNPAVHPDRDLTRHLGMQPVYHSDETVDVRPEYLDELRALRVGPMTRPERCLLVAATGDEVLDWRDMVARYPQAAQRIVDGSDHGLSDFDDYIDDVIDFALGGADPANAGPSADESSDESADACADACADARDDARDDARGDKAGDANADASGDASGNATDARTTPGPRPTLH